MKYAIMMCLLHQMIVTSDSLQQVHLETKDLQNKMTHYDCFRELQNYVHDTYAFKVIHDQYAQGVKIFGVVSAQEQDLLDSLFKLHMRKEFLDLQAWNTTVAQRTNFEYDFEPFSFSVGVGCYALAAYMYWYCRKNDSESMRFIMHPCIPLLIILGNLALYEAVNYSKSIKGRIVTLDKNYKIAFPTRDIPLSVIAKPVKKNQHVYYPLPLLP
jgi:hypothetical protein